MQKVGFIGLGLMGGPMAANIARAGHPLAVYNRTASKADEVKGLGAQVATSPREVAENSEVIVTMLSDAPAVEAVLVGEDGLLAGARVGAVLIDMSTVAPDQTKDLAEMVEAAGMKMLDAPVYGSTGPAKDGTLGIMVGGEKAVFDAQQDLLGVMGKNIFYMGPQGSGAMVKLCFNLVVAAQILSLAEAMALAAKGGLNLEEVGEVITSSGISSNLIERKVGNMAEGNFPPAFPLKHMHKDLGLMVQTGVAVDVALPATGVTHQIYTAAKARGHGDEDFSAIYAVLAQMASIGK
jgi:3-hydroxyisobutyrate dehydrogenase-like beta-hydroxyacid dehydrogenase